MAQKPVTQEPEAKVSYKDTLNLPRTDFPIRAQAAIDDVLLLERWKQEDLYKAAFTHNKGNEKFVLHDGPPYANGHIHLGHAYNKILKDIITKSQRMMGKYVPVTPGWDCHGLPIEFKVAGDNPGASRQELQTKCRAYAQQWIDAQKEEFKKLGILMDWDHPYITMNPQQEADTVRGFGHAVEDGYISRKNKTVPWCATCQTVLAAAEIEYEDRKDPSLYVKFALCTEDVLRVFKMDKKVSLVMWTTTPWTIALNRALFLKPEASYDLLDINGDLIIVGSALADSICAALEVEKNVIATRKAEELVGSKANHPFIENFQVPVLADQFVGLSDGTAVVHCAPGCGPEDYEMGLRYNLEIFSPVGPNGAYTQGIKPIELEGMNIKDALSWVITTLQNNDALLYKSSIKHPFPHCWRCRQGLIFRATKQWFCELSKNSLRERALAALEKVTFIPHSTRNHLKAAVSGRLEWCLSRQRAWGTPIIAIICTSCDKEHTTTSMIESVAQKIVCGGIEAWNSVEISELISHDFTCGCGSKTFRKEQNILDVWFDSGVTHQTVLKNNPSLQYPADLYLEGVDQHRGWFQSSLLTSMMYGDVAPFAMVATHGFTVDEKGRKMSKSLNNGVEPQQLVERLGTDGLRLWASSIDMEGDAVVSEKVLANVQEVFRKIRNTCRGLLMNLYDFDNEKDAVELAAMNSIDKQALHELSLFNDQVIEAYQEKDSTRVFHMIADYCSVQVSSLYLDMAKDRLYTDQADGLSRRSSQTVCWHMLDTLTKLIAPVLSFTAEQLSDHYQKNKKESIHLQNFAPSQFLFRNQYAQEANNESEEAIRYENKKHEQWEALAGMRSAVLKAIEMLRQKSVIKHSLEAKVTITMDTTRAENTLIKGLLSEAGAGLSAAEMVKQYCIVSACDIVETENTDDWSEIVDDEYEEQDFDDSVTYVDGGLGMQIKVEHAQGAKCPRCWQWEVTEHKDGLCSRCQRVVERQTN